jgi:hypothetical protein
VDISFLLVCAVSTKKVKVDGMQPVDAPWLVSPFAGFEILTTSNDFVFVHPLLPITVTVNLYTPNLVYL